MGQKSDQQVVMITGCSDGGLGAALAIAFHKAGYRVVATARNLSKLKDTRLHGIEDLELDVLSNDSLATCIKQFEALTGGRLDMLINNAGAGYNMPVLDIDLNEARKVFDLNVWSLVSVSRAFLPFLMKTPNAKIVNQLSVAAYASIPVQGVYSSSKAAANMITENLRLELKPFNIRVIALMTGSVHTKFFENHQAAHGDSPLPEDSIYRVVPGGLKMLQDPKSILGKDAMNAETWAQQIVGDLKKKNPPHQIYRGTNASMVRVGALLPIGTLDTQLMKLSKFDEVEKALK